LRLLGCYDAPLFSLVRWVYDFRADLEFCECVESFWLRQISIFPRGHFITGYFPEAKPTFSFEIHFLVSSPKIAQKVGEKSNVPQLSDTFHSRKVLSVRKKIAQPPKCTIFFLTFLQEACKSKSAISLLKLIKHVKNVEN